MIKKNKLKYYCKRFAAGLLVALLVFSSGGNSVWADDSQDNVKSEDTIWVCDDSGKILTAYNGTEASLEIPSDLNITAIGDSAFEGKSITYISIPEGVTSIGKSAFKDCKSLMTMSLPSTLTTIGESAFEGSRLQYLQLPTSLETIEKNAFKDCTYLLGYYVTNQSVIIPDSIASIGESAFSGCTTINALTINNDTDTLTIGASAFSGCTGLKTVTIKNGSDSSVNISSQAFSGCTALDTFTINNNSSSIASDAFNGCDKLTNKPGSETTEPPKNDTENDTENSANSNTEANSTEVNDTETNNDWKEEITTSDDGSVWKYKVSQSTNSKILISFTPSETFSGVISIPDDVTSIDSKAFYNCSNLQSISIPSTVTSIGSGAFSECHDSLTVIILSYNDSGINYESLTDAGLDINKNRVIIIKLPEQTVYTSKITDYGLTISDNITTDSISITYDCKKSVRYVYTSEYGEYVSTKTDTDKGTTPNTAGKYTASVKITAEDNDIIFNSPVEYTINQGEPTEILKEYMTLENITESISTPVTCKALVSLTGDIISGTISTRLFDNNSYYVTFTPDDLTNYKIAYFQFSEDNLTIGGNVITPGPGDTTLVPGDENGDSTGDDSLVTPGDDSTLNPDNENNDDNTNDGTDGNDDENKDEESGSTTVNNGRRKAGSTDSGSGSNSDSGSGSDSDSDSDETLGTDSVDTNENNLFDTIANTIADFMSNKNDVILGGIVNIKEAISSGKITRKLAIWMFSIGVITLGTIIYITYPLIKRRKEMKVQPTDAPEKDDTENNEIK
jgi:hypothetical protein